MSNWPFGDSRHHADGWDAPPPPMADLLEALGNYLHLDDTGHVWFALATAVSASFEGDPLWGMLVGASSGGKTETIRALDGVAGHVDELTSASLLSWYRPKKGQWRPTGVLLRVGDCGLLTIGDFSTVLAMSDRGTRDQLFANLRRVYDGHLSRDVANAPGSLQWSGRVTILAGCTPAIDNYSAHANQLGPRWLFYRLGTKPTQEKRVTSRKARAAAAEVRKYRAEVQHLAHGIVSDAGQRARDAILSDEAGGQIDDMAIVTCFGRGVVPRNGYGRREIEGLAVVEEPPRLAGQLTQLALGLVALGLDETAALRLCRRAALDSMPEVRRRVLDQLATSDRELTVTEVANGASCHRAVARRTLEDLHAIGLVDGEDADEDPDARYRPHCWWLAGDDIQLIRTVLAEARCREVTRKVGSTPQHPPPEKNKGIELDRASA
jgi:IclR-like helix-turn-helix domain-containing protein